MFGLNHHNAFKFARRLNIAFGLCLNDFAQLFLIILEHDVFDTTRVETEIVASASIKLWKFRLHKLRCQLIINLLSVSPRHSTFILILEVYNLFKHHFIFVIFLFFIFFLLYLINLGFISYVW